MDVAAAFRPHHAGQQIDVEVVAGTGLGNQLVHIGIGKLGLRDRAAWRRNRRRIGNRVHGGNLGRIHFHEVAVVLVGKQPYFAASLLPVIAEKVKAIGQSDLFGCVQGRDSSQQSEGPQPAPEDGHLAHWANSTTALSAIS